jgi:hypothetical protein
MNSKLTVDTPLQAVAHRESLPEPVTVCSIFLLPILTSSWNYSHLLSLVSQLPSAVLLLGDLNSHRTL